MILGIGTDIIEIDRIKSAIDRFNSKFLDRLFTEKEQVYCQKHREPERHFAGRFAAKEAIVKAFGTGFRDGISWTDIEILNDENGKPEIILSQNLKNQFPFQISLSISHCKEYATAFAIVHDHLNP